MQKVLLACGTAPDSYSSVFKIDTQISAILNIFVLLFTLKATDVNFESRELSKKQLGLVSEQDLLLGKLRAKSSSLLSSKRKQFFVTLQAKTDFVWLAKLRKQLQVAANLTNHLRGLTLSYFEPKLQYLPGLNLMASVNASTAFS